jgi:hypothetical protein
VDGKLRAEIFDASSGPRIDLKTVLQSLCEMSKMNAKYYQQSAVKFDAAAGQLKQATDYQPALAHFGTTLVSG